MAPRCKPLDLTASWLVMASLAIGAAACTPQALAPPGDPWRTPAIAPTAAPLPTTPPRAAVPIQAPDLPGSVRALKFTLTVPSDDSDATRYALDVAKALVAAGFQLSDGPADASIAVGARPLDGSAGELALSVIVRHRDVPIESIVGRVSSTDRVRAAVDLSDLAARVVSSSKIAAFAAHQEQARLALLKTRGSAARPPEAVVDPAQLEEQAWRPAGLRHCRNARSETACRWVRTYLERFPRGAHAAEARALLGLPVPNDGAATVATK